MFPSSLLHQEIVRDRHAEILRAARREQLAALVTAERERSTLVRIGRLIERRLPRSLWRRLAHAYRPARAV